LIKAANDALLDASSRLVFLPDPGDDPSPPNVDLPLPPPLEEQFRRVTNLEGEDGSVLKRPEMMKDWTRRCDPFDTRR
jgi:hypothetical protein